MSADLHPAGQYLAEIKDHGIGKSKTKETPQVVVKFETEHGNIYGYFPLTPKAATYTAEKVRAMGFQRDNFEDLNDGECLVGNRCLITVQHEEYQGETRARVGFVDAEDAEPRGVKRDADAAKRAKTFNALLKKAKRPAASEQDEDDNPPF